MEGWSKEAALISSVRLRAIELEVGDSTVAGEEEDCCMLGACGVWWGLRNL